MNRLVFPVDRPQAGDPLQVTFLKLLPTLEATARAHLRHVPCHDRRCDLLCEAVALAWLWYLRLARKGRTPADFLITFARLAARAALSGRRVYGSESTRDVLSPTCRWRRGFAVSPLPDTHAASDTAFEEALCDNTVTPVPDQVAFRCDYPRWRASLCRPTRKLMDAMAAGHRGTELAEAFGLTQGRISQVRRELCESWRAFCSDDRG
jgi:hypothetical protein